MFRRVFLKFVALTGASLALTAEDALSEARQAETAVQSNNGAHQLSNEFIEVRLDREGLTSLTDKVHGHTVAFHSDTSSLSVDNYTLSTARRDPVRVEKGRNSFVYVYAIGRHTLKVVYELRPGWHFVTKQLVFDLKSSATAVQVRQVDMMNVAIRNAITETVAIAKGARGVFLRWKKESRHGGYGALLTLQNPMIDWQLDQGAASLSYAPDMEWKASYGPFESDRAIIAPYELSGIEYRFASLPEWQYYPDAATARDVRRKLDMAEIDCFAGCVRPWMIAPPAGTNIIHVGWTENDFQIDVGTAAGRTEYKRIIDRASELGVRHLLFAPANSQVSSLSQNTDAWGCGERLVVRLGPEDPEGTMGSRKRSPSFFHHRDAGLRQGAWRQTGGLRVPVGRLPAESGVDSLVRQQAIRLSRSGHRGP